MADVRVEMFFDGEWHPVAALGAHAFEEEGSMTTFAPGPDHYRDAFRSNLETCLERPSALWVVFADDTEEILYGPGAAGPFRIAPVPGPDD